MILGRNKKMPTREVLTIYGYKKGRKSHRVFMITGKDGTKVTVPYVKSKKKTQKLILCEILKQKGINSHFKKEEVELSLKNSRTLSLLFSYREPPTRRILAEIIMVDKGKIIIRSKDFRGKKRQRMQNEIRKYLREHNWVSKRNKLMIKETSPLEKVGVCVTVDVLINEVVIGGYIVYPIVTTQEKEVRLR